MLEYIINLPPDIKNKIVSYHYKTSPEKDNLVKIIKNNEFLYNKIIKECYKTYPHKRDVSIEEYIDYKLWSLIYDTRNIELSTKLIKIYKKNGLNLLNNTNINNNIIKENIKNIINELSYFDIIFIINYIKKN